MDPSIPGMKDDHAAADVGAGASGGRTRRVTMVQQRPTELCVAWGEGPTQLHNSMVDCSADWSVGAVGLSC